MKRRFHVDIEVLLVVFTILWTAGTLFGQGSAAGTITGIITDPSSATVPGAAVVVRNLATGFSRGMKTDSSGNYAFPDLAVGTYELRVSATGFETAQVASIRLEVNGAIRQDVQMKVGAVASTVEVQAAAPLLNTQNASVGQVIATQEVIDLPLNGRDFQQLQLLSPGSLSTYNFQTTSGLDAGASSLTTNETMNLSNGGRPGQVLFTVDGADDSNQNGRGILWRPSIDEISEFKVQTADMSAEFGYGSSVVNVSVKSGTNSMHGSGYDFLRNDAMDARSFFAQSKEPLKRNEFGATVGGPVVLPHIYNGKDRTFWFFGYEGMRLRQGTINFATVPTAKMRTGDFSELPTQLYDPTTTRPDPNLPGAYIRDPFVGNQIPGDRIDPVAKFFLDPAWIPSPDLPGISNNLFDTFTVPTNSNEMTAKMDHRIGANDTLSGRFSFTREDDGSFGPYHGLVTCDPASNPKYPNSYNSVLTWTHMFNPTNLLEARMSYSRAHLLFDTPNMHLSQDYDQVLGIAGFGHGISDVYPSYPEMDITGYTGLPKGFLLNYTSNNFEYTANYNMIRGRHTFKMGETFRSWQQNITTSGSASGDFSFNGTYTGDPETSTTTGAGIADFFLGTPQQAGRYPPPGWYYQRLRNNWLYFNDELKVTSKLSLTWGVRYEINWPTTEKYLHFATFDPAARGGQGALVVPNAESVAIPSSINDVNLSWPTYSKIAVYAADVGINPKYLRPVSHDKFAPRFGVAYRVSEKTVVRGGYGLFWVQLDGNRESEHEGVPFGVREGNILQDPLFPTKTIQNFMPKGSTFSLTPTVYGSDPTVSDFGYSQEWNLSIQRQFPGNFSTEIAYVGTKGTRLQSMRGINVPTPGPGDVQARRPLPEFGYIQWNEQSASSIYHSLQVKGERRFSKGFSLVTAFTWSRSIDYDSTDAEGYYDPYHPGLNRGPSSFDLPLVFTLASVSELPRLPNANKFVRGALGGWSASPMVTLESGFPFTPTAYGDPTNTGTGTWADVVAGCNPNLSNPTPQRWFNTACFVTPPGPPIYRYGNAGRDILRGDGYPNVDFGIHKDFRLGSEQRKLQFRIEGFNLFNWHSFGFPVAAVNDPAYGVISSSSSPRILQVAGKLYF